MTPTLEGRIETRITLSLVIALPILIFSQMGTVFFTMLAIGVVSDFIYNHLQNKRWDGDWPHIYSLFSGLSEGTILWLIIRTPTKADLASFSVTYLLIWSLMFIASTTALNIILPHRRFRGGKIL